MKQIVKLKVVLMVNLNVVMVVVFLVHGNVMTTMTVLMVQMKLTVVEQNVMKAFLYVMQTIILIVMVIII